MALKKCYECGKDVSSGADTCPSCGARLKTRILPRKLGCGGCLVIIIAAAIIVGISSKIFSPPNPETKPIVNKIIPTPPTTQQQSAELKRNPVKLIDYKILRKWNPHNMSSNLGLEILVSPNSSKEEVIGLAKHIRISNSDKNFLIVSIFDSKVTYRNRDNEKYPDSEFEKHHLLDIFGNEMTWMKNGATEKIPLN